MSETLDGEVIHVVAPDEQEDYDLDPTLESLADSQYILVCRKGGSPSWVDRILAFLRRDPIEAITIVADSEVPEGEELTATVDETDLGGVYRARRLH